MNNSEPNWICCQIGAREHYAVARALHRHRALAQLLTDAWVRPASPLGVLRPGLRARFHVDLAAADVYAPNIGNIAFELGARAAGLRNWPLMVARNNWFQKMVVARLLRVTSSHATRTIMAYSYAALEIFKLARTRGWPTVLGQIDPGFPEERIVAELYDSDPVQLKGWHPPPPKYWSNWRKECMLADRIVVNSRWSLAALLDEGVPASKIRVIPLAYGERGQVPGFRRQYPPEFTFDRPLQVLFLGQINLRKGVGPLFEAIRMLRGDPVKFTFVGPEQILIPLDLRQHPQVRWIGAVPRHDTERFYRDADVLLFPTFSDGFGINQLEAQEWKLPIIASKFCGEVVDHGRNGFLLPEITPVAIAEVIRQCLQSPICLQHKSDKSGVAESFTLRRVGEEWLNIFD